MGIKAYPVIWWVVRGGMIELVEEFRAEGTTTSSSISTPSSLLIWTSSASS